MKYELLSNLEIEECKTRMNNSIDSRLFSILLSSSEWIGRVKEETFWLQKRNREFRNSFSKIFYGSFHKNRNGTVIRGSFKIHRCIKIFIAAWISGISAITLSIIAALFDINQVNRKVLEKNLICGLFTAIIMLFFGVFIIKVGSRLSKIEEKNTINFLEKILNAKQIDSQ
ncbi:hypothetical protein [Alkaliphilus oremlandii]|uniref:Uncharacterized protein n=1 Tax=Alkaliphilus oremlandii (strain OhILAs) TaxID=350688 RepID=A8MEX1_ALKOO|nr:hypothetical protein [Alkaliphilus oremlandii]ABW18450.1 hypothetical protein Clos_0903 [Alkaliphilus oremlandii OhILAs]